MRMRQKQFRLRRSLVRIRHRLSLRRLSPHLQPRRQLNRQPPSLRRLNQ
jgi:hypothetical protein